MNYEAIALWSQVIAAVVFAVLIVLGFVHFITPAINRSTQLKNEEIRENERRRDEAVRAVEEARAELARAQADGQRIRASIEHDAQREAAMIVAGAHSEAQRLIRNARGEMERERLAARDTLRVELIEHALNAARKEAARRIDAATDAMLVDRFVTELERREVR
jgi:F-type H+-transporting ATPase subunit b